MEHDINIIGVEVGNEYILFIIFRVQSQIMLWQYVVCAHFACFAVAAAVMVKVMIQFDLDWVLNPFEVKRV